MEALVVLLPQGTLKILVVFMNGIIGPSFIKAEPTDIEDKQQVAVRAMRYHQLSILIGVIVMINWQHLFYVSAKSGLSESSSSVESDSWL
jgi:hypothetical protein